jgi:hypothetical protein
MPMVKVFKYDEWVDMAAIDVQAGDIFANKDHTYQAIGEPYARDGQLHLPAEPFVEGPIVISFESDKEYIHRAMDCVYCSARDFGDGTMQICELVSDDGKAIDYNVYSPRLSIAELNAFCKRHLETYQAFCDEHEQRLSAGDSVPMTPFWKKIETDIVEKCSTKKS